MTDSDKITYIQALVDNDAEATNALLSIYLADAKERILNRMYPYGVPTTVTSVPSKYDYLHIRLTERLFLRRGAEGEEKHDENGIIRKYKDTNDDDILSQIMPILKVVER